MEGPDLIAELIIRSRANEGRNLVHRRGETPNFGRVFLPSLERFVQQSEPWHVPPYCVFVLRPWPSEVDDVLIGCTRQQRDTRRIGQCQRSVRIQPNQLPCEPGSNQP